MIVTTAELYKVAYGKFAVCACNINNMEQLLGLFGGNVQSRAPFIIHLPKDARCGLREREKVALAAASELKITSETLVLLCSQLKTVTFTLQELATMSNGKLLGDPARQITGAASLVEATDGEVSFFNNPKYVALLRKTRASAVFVP